MDFLDHRPNKARPTPAEAELKIRSWCAYQERSQDETRHKLREFGLSSEDAEAMIARLIGENFLNEERFALAFAGGKFRIKHWGRNKIRIELKKHKVSDYCINKALNAIPADDYERVLTKVLEKKLSGLKSTDARKTFYIVLKYAVSRGFESDLVSGQLNLLKEKNES